MNEVQIKKMNDKLDLIYAAIVGGKVKAERSTTINYNTSINDSKSRKPRVILSDKKKNKIRKNSKTMSNEELLEKYQISKSYLRTILLEQ